MTELPDEKNSVQGSTLDGSVVDIEQYCRILMAFRNVKRELINANERIRQLEEGFNQSGTLGARLGLTRAEAQIFGVILAKGAAGAGREQILSVLYEERDHIPGAKIIDVLVCRIRRKLEPFGIEIGTRWGIGYVIDAESSRRAFEAAASADSLRAPSNADRAYAAVARGAFMVARQIQVLRTDRVALSQFLHPASEKVRGQIKTSPASRVRGAKSQVTAATLAGRGSG